VEAERRQVTVLFTNMVGFTTFSERAGEEAVYTLMRSPSELMDEAVCEQGGVVRGFSGDGLMAVFSALVAFEDAPLCACRAALSILRRIRVAGDELEVKHGLRPQLRMWGGRSRQGATRHRRCGHGSRRHGECRGAPAGFGRTRSWVKPNPLMFLEAICAAVGKIPL
jgi:hypothetical protein